jgi:hypothetical protein
MKSILLLAPLLLAAAGPDPRGVAMVTVVVGTVEARPNSDPAWKPLAQGAVLEADTWIKTAPKGRALLEYPDGTEVRINEGTEIHVQAARKLHLKDGRIYAIVANGAPFVAASEFSAMETEVGKFDLEFRVRAENDPDRKKVSRTVTTVLVLDGKLKVPSKRYSQVLTAGYTCTLVDAQLNTPDPIANDTLATAWVHALLVRPKDAAEVKARLGPVLTELGEAKKDDPCEPALRDFGPRAAPDVLAYLKMPSGPIDAPRRRAAARIMAETAPASCAADLAALLKDADPDVRVPAARGLQRLAGQDLGMDEAFWRGAKFADGHKAWTDWLAKNGASLTAPKK